MWLCFSPEKSIIEIQIEGGALMLDRENAVREIDGTVVKVDDYEKIKAKQELYRLLEEGIAAEKAGNLHSVDEVFDSILKGLEE